MGPNLGCQNFFSKKLALSVTRYHGQLSQCTISEKTNAPILKKPSHGQTDRQTDRRTDKTDESDFIGCCSINVECPTPQRPVVGFPMAMSFQECIAMDLKFYKREILLHLIDHQCQILSPLRLFEPEKFLTDNGGIGSIYEY